MSQMSKDITPSCPRSGTVPDCLIQGHVPSKYQYWVKAYVVHDNSGWHEVMNYQT